MGGLTLRKCKHAQHPQLLYLPSLLSLTLRPNLAQGGAFSVLPVLLFRWLPCFPASFACVHWCLHQLVFMILVHEPWCLCLTSSLCFFLLSLLGFLRLWRQKQCPISSSFRARFLLWTIPSSSNFSGLTDILYHYLVFEGKSGIF